MRKNIKRVACLTLATTLAFSAVSCGSPAATEGNGAGASDAKSMKAGTYKATAKGNNGDISFEVTVTDKEVKEIKVVESGETPGLGDVAMEKMIGNIVDNQTLAVDTVTGATMSSNAVLTAVEDCLKQAGADIKNFQTAVEKTGEDETMETQVVVVGGGASGTAAALQAVDEGAKVILVEMTATPAGQGTQAGGMFATHSTEQKESNNKVTDEWVYNQFLLTSNYTMNGALISKLIQNSGSTVDWLEDNGCDLILAHPGSGSYLEHVTTHPDSTLHGYVEGGTQAITNLHASIEEKGGKVLYSTEAKELIINNGNIEGIVAEKEDGGTLTIKADAVILATGGFGGNEELVKKTFGEGYGVSRIATNIGTGINMAIQAGADASFDDAITMHYGASRGGTGWTTTLNTALLHPFLHVDVDGNRFMNEESFIFEPIKTTNVLKSLPQRTAYEIFDQTMIDIVKEQGTIGLNNAYPGKLATDPTVFVEVGHPVDTGKRSEAIKEKVDLTEEINKLVEEGVIIKADTKEELAEKLGMAHLADTITRYNELSEAGKDTDHFKSSEYLETLEGPLYAVKITPSVFLGTLGGIEINDNCEVLNEEGKAIKGLFAAGSETNGAYGNSYVYFEGGTLGYAYGTGRIAGQSAAQAVVK